MKSFEEYLGEITEKLPHDKSDLIGKKVEFTIVNKLDGKEIKGLVGQITAASGKDKVSIRGTEKDNKGSQYQINVKQITKFID